MPLFEYKAATSTGEVLEGQMEADDRDAVIRRLQAQGQVPIRADQLQAGPRRAERGAGGPTKRGRFGRRQLGAFTLELSTLLDAGLPLDRSLGVLLELADTQAMHGLVSRLRAAVRSGKDLSEAMQAETSIFFPLYVNLVRAGEAGGALDQALARLSEFMDRSRELRESVVSALVYPCILVLLSLASLMLILTVVVPRFATLFDDAGQELPVITQIVVGVAGFLQSYWWALFAVGFGIFFYARQLMRDPVARERIDRTSLRLPLAGDFIAKLEVARFARALGTLLENGVPLLDSLVIAKQIVVNTVIANAVSEVADNVRAGQGIAKPLIQKAVFPELACHMLQVGEETGQLDKMLMKLAEIYDREVRSALQRLVTIIEPVVILGLGVMVAGIIFSVLAAILQVNELAF